jgi:nitroreductase
MSEKDQVIKTLNTIIRTRRSTRNFRNVILPPEEINGILQAAILAPFGGATSIPFKEIRKIFVFSQGTEKMARAQELLLKQMKISARKLNIILFLFPFFKKRMQNFATRITSFAKNGIPGMLNGSFYIIVAERRGFPPVEKKSIAHALQNMWLMATAQGLGFQLLSATGMMSKNKEFMELLGLKVGDYEIDGCIIGRAQKDFETRSEYQLEDFVTWK